MSNLTLTGAGAAGAAAVATYSTAVLADSPLAYWRLGESSGTAAADASGNGHVGTYTGSFTLGAAGGTTDGNTAVTFAAASTGYVLVGNSAAFDLTGDLTLECIVKPTDFANFNMLITNDETNQPRPFEYRLEQTTGKPNLICEAANTPRLGTAAPSTGVYSHLAVTVSGTTVTHYLNGAANGSIAGIGVRQATSFVSNLIIGQRDDLGLALNFKGAMDEVAVYGTALSAARILAHHNAR